MENNSKNHFTASLISLVIEIIGVILFFTNIPTYVTLILEVFAFVLVPKMDKEEKGYIIGIIAKILPIAFLIILVLAVIILSRIWCNFNKI